jgi:hypothetical protein
VTDSQCTQAGYLSRYPGIRCELWVHDDGDGATVVISPQYRTWKACAMVGVRWPDCMPALASSTR